MNVLRYENVGISVEVVPNNMRSPEFNNTGKETWEFSIYWSLYLLENYGLLCKTFTENGINNFHNELVWEIENPHSINAFPWKTLRKRLGCYSSIMKLSDKICCRLNGDMHWAFLEINLPLLLEDIASSNPKNYVLLTWWKKFIILRSYPQRKPVHSWLS